MNNSKFIIEMVQINCCIGSFSIQDNDYISLKSKLFIESGKSKHISIETPLILLEKESIDPLQTQLDIATYRKEYYNLGDSNKLDGSVSCFDKANVKKIIGNVINLSEITYYQDDAYEENGNVQISVNGLFVNITKLIIGGLKFEMHLIDDAGEIVTTSSSSSNPIEPNGKESISIRSIGLELDRIKHLKLRLYLSVYFSITRKIINMVAIEEGAIHQTPHP
jgi:hypothetical protein